MIDERYKVDNLFLLIGKNTLPNYVAAKLLLRDPATSKLLLVYSPGDEGTGKQRDILEKVLRAEGFQHFDNIEVNENDPQDIAHKITSKRRRTTGTIGLNYTGGTKAMAVHAFEAVHKPDQDDVQFSYLDARNLNMVVSGAISGSFPVGTAVQVLLKVLLELHSLKLSFKTDPIWPQTARAIAELHADDEKRKKWHEWIAKTFLKDPQWPNFASQTIAEHDHEWQNLIRQQFVWKEYRRRRWKSKNDLRNIPLSVLSEFSDVQKALFQETNLSDSHSFYADKQNNNLMKSGEFNDSEDLGTWFEGEWLESYVLQQVQNIKNIETLSITDVGRGLQVIGANQTEIDVAFTCGYQLFALSCTSASEKSLCKHKLLEVALRAEQIGGAEARSALICCYDKPHALKKEVEDLYGQNVQVFGRDNLLEIQGCLENWINDVSQ